MNRRRFLRTSLAAGVGLAGLAVGHGAMDDTLDVRVWFTEAAAGYDGLRERVEGYLSQAFGRLRDGVRLTFGRPVSVSTENGYRVTATGEWPAKLATGPPSPVDDVNLLVTDGQMQTSPTGVGLPHVASVGGARHVARMPPAEDGETVVPFRNRARITQVLVHEVGHALGLGHDHGTIVDGSTHVVVSPMVSAYAWATGNVRERQFDYRESACGSTYPSVEGKEGRLDMIYSECALRRIEAVQFDTV